VKKNKFRFIYILPAIVCVFVSITAGAFLNGALSEVRTDADEFSETAEFSETSEVSEASETTETSETSTDAAERKSVILFYIIDLTDGGFDSVFDLAMNHPEFDYAITFYEGDGFAYIEVRDVNYTDLQVYFEDYRTGRTYLISHAGSDAFSEFWFEGYLDEFDRDPEPGMRVKARPLGARGNPEDFRAAAGLISGRGIYPAKLDYAAFVDENGYADEQAIAEYAFDKERVLDGMCAYRLVIGTEKTLGGSATRYADDREHLAEFMDFYYGLDLTYDLFGRGGEGFYNEVFNVVVSVGELGNTRTYVFANYDDSYYIGADYGCAYITKDRYDWLKQWAEPVVNLTEDFAPLS